MCRWIAAIVMTCACLAPAAPEASDLVRGDLIADADAIVAGQTFRLGVRLVMSPHWHVYWKHPGETGLPSTVQLKLPDGFTAGDVRYPVPQRFVQPGDIEGFGYADEVVLMIDVTPPDQILSRPVVIEASVSYLVCENVCVPGNLKLSIELPINAMDPAAQPAPAKNAQSFAQWNLRLPQSAEPTEITGELPAEPATSMTDFSATVPLAEPGGELEVFPQTPDALEAAGWSVEGGDAFAIVRFKARLLKGIVLKNNSLPILLAYTDQRGARKGVSFEVPLRNAEPEN